MTVRALDTLLAIKVINLTPDLRPSDRRVGVILIEHFNRRSGRCDPGLERIADLLGLSTRTIIRSTQRLEAAKLFRKARHGGYSNRNSYEPNWPRFTELETAWKQRLQQQAHARRSRLSLTSGQPSHIRGDQAVTQTYIDNRQYETYADSRASEGRLTRSSLCEPPRPIAISTKPSDAALAAAERRWSRALHQQFACMPVTYGDVIAAINPSMQAAATEAEMHHRGAGLTYILTQLKLDNLKC